MKRKIIFIMSSIFTLLLLASCSKKASYNNALMSDYSDVYVEISDEALNDIETAYKTKYGKDIKWCMPDRNVNGFKTYEELEKYIESNYGFRLYGKHNDSYVICFFYDVSPLFLYDFLYYKDILLLDNKDVFHIEYRNTFIYSNGMITECSEDTEVDIHPFINITEKEALQIKENHRKYIETFFGKFKTDEDTNLRETYLRLYNSLMNNDSPTPTTPVVSPTGIPKQ